MRIILTFILLGFTNLAKAQWVSTFQFDPTLYYTAQLNFIDFADESNGFLVAEINETGTPPIINRVFHTIDGGVTWDSIDFQGYIILNLNHISPNVCYINTRRSVFTGPVPYIEHGLLRTIDAGQNWTFIDITNEIPFATIQEDALHFMNDSVAIYCNNSSTYLTFDYGNTWSVCDSSVGSRNPISMDNKFVYFQLYDVITFNPFTEARTQTTYNGHCEGNMFEASSNGHNCVRYQLAQNGVTLNGYSVQNFTSITLLNENKVIHILDQTGAADVLLTENNIYWSNGALMRSMDKGSSFFFQESLEPEGFTNTSAGEMVFPSDSVGYVISYNPSPGIGYKILKTTNSGGITSNYIGNIIEVTASIDETEHFELEVYPNPVSNNLSIRSTEIINEIILYDNAGREIERRVPNQLETEIHFSELIDGSYVLIVRTNKGNATRKIVKR